jgi:tyrocidine synthetase-3
LTRPPLVRGILIRSSDTSHVLGLDVHHTLFDGSSLGVLFHELSILYSGGQLPPLARSYKDYSAWRMASLEQPAMREAENFWLAQFNGNVPVISLPTDFPRPSVRNYEGAVFQATFDGELAAQVRALGQREGATLFMVLLAAYSVLLSKVSGQDDVIVGSSVAGRTHPDLEPLIGMFVNTLAFRNRPQETLSFSEFLARVRTNCIQAYKFQSYPLESLIRKLDLAREPSRSFLFDTMIVLQNMDLGTATFANGLTLSAVQFARKSAKYDLTFEFYDDADKGLTLNVEYSVALFRPETIEALTTALRQILAAVSLHPEAKLKDIPVDLDVALKPELNARAEVAVK